MEVKESKKDKNTENNIVRIFVSKESEASLNDITAEVNQGFDAGRVTRSDIANFILLQFKENLNDTDIQRIRTKYFSVVAQMEAILKKIKNGEKVPQNVMDAISESYLGLAAPAKKSKKPLIDKSTNGRLIESEQV